MDAQIKLQGVVGLVKITDDGGCKIEIFPMQGDELPINDGEEVMIRQVEKK